MEERTNPQVVLGKYEMGRLLGKGTFAKVYQGWEVATGESVAIKVINKAAVKKQGMMAQIEREIEIMRLVRHPHVVNLMEVMATKSRIFFVMEYVGGGELFSRVCRRKLGEEEARKYFQQLICAVEYCHGRGVYHRDLKPENLLLDRDGNLKVSDFGLSAFSDQLWQDGLLHTLCGTPAYVAPEVLRKRGYEGASADLWSCGVVLFAMLAGFLPFQDENVVRMYTKMFKNEFEFPGWFSPGAKRLVSKLLIADPHRRITIPDMKRDAWFSKGFDFSSSVKERREVPCQVPEEKSLTPPFFNAFELMSCISPGLDLSGLFESESRTRMTFASRASVTEVMMKIEDVAKKTRFHAVKISDSEVRLIRSPTSECGDTSLSVKAKVLHVAPGVAVLELCMSSRDPSEYSSFCDKHIRPAVQDNVDQ